MHTGAEPGEDVVYGLLRMADMDVALPLSALREVVPCPAELAGLPAAAPGLLGAMELRRMVLPVVDLRAVLGRPGERRPDQVVVVVAFGGQVLGLLADEVRGVSTVAAAAMVAARADGGLLFSHTFRHPETGQAYSVLDAAAVLGTLGVPTVADVTREGSGASPGTRANGSGRTLTVLRCGAYRFAIDVTHVHTTLPAPRPRASVLSSRMCRGVIEFADREVPIVDPLVLLGLGELAPEDTDAGLVLDLGPGYVVLALSALLELAEVGAEQVLAVPAFAVPRPELLSGIVDIDGLGDCLVLDGAALLADAQLTGFASVNTAVEHAAAQEADSTSTAAAAASGAPAYLTFSVGVDVATRLEQVTEILPFPTTLTSTAVAGVLGLVVHRNAAVPVIRLAELLGREAAPITADACLLLVSAGGAPVAFAVDALRGIDPLTWTDVEQRRHGGAVPGTSLRSAPLVQVGGDPRLLPDLDLREMARILQETGSAAGPVQSAGAPAEPLTTV